MTDSPAQLTPLGPQILFFSGGTALRETAAEVARHTTNTVHLITPFDSGGSSATLRQAFGMPAVGDIRSRIMTLAEQTREGNREIYTLFAYRLPRNESRKKLQAELVRLARGNHPLLRQIPAPMNGIICEHLTWFAMQMPADFPLAGASVGNLVLAAGYLRNNRRLSPVIALFSRMIKARGVVRPTVEDPAHLAVRLASGEVIVGQHKFSGKETRGVTSPITGIWLAREESSPTPAYISITARTEKLIKGARCICYPIGSFYSSVVANLLPHGVGRAVASCRGRKVFVPNLGSDPELAGHSLAVQIERLLRPLLEDTPGSQPANFLNEIIVDRKSGQYPGGIPDHLCSSLGITITDAPLVLKQKSPLADSRLLAQAILKASGAPPAL